MTIEELANYLKVAEQTLRRWVLNREIPFCKIKKVIRFRVSEIEKWVDNRGTPLTSVAKADALLQKASNELFDEIVIESGSKV
jgi:PTS system nitrogen regulatory IIA component